jgi:hypothetical protein
MRSEPVRGVMLAGGLPVPRQQGVDLLRRMIGDAGEHVGEPRLGIDAREFAALDQSVHDGGAVAAGVGATEGPIPSAYGNRAPILPMLGRMSLSTIVGIRCTDAVHVASRVSDGQRVSSYMSS